MSFDVSAQAREDAVATIRFYNAQPERYGEAFRVALEGAFDRIVETPQLFSRVEDGIPDREIREFFIERFQRRVIYQVNGNDVLVLAVVRASRRPGAWHRNLPTDPPAETT